MTLPHLRNVPFLKQASYLLLCRLSSALHHAVILPHDFISQRGKKMHSSFWILTDGQVAIFDEKDQLVAIQAASDTNVHSEDCNSFDSLCLFQTDDDHDETRPSPDGDEAFFVHSRKHSTDSSLAMMIGGVKGKRHGNRVVTSRRESLVRVDSKQGDSTASLFESFKGNRTSSRKNSRKGSNVSSSNSKFTAQSRRRSMIKDPGVEFLQTHMKPRAKDYATSPNRSPQFSGKTGSPSKKAGVRRASIVVKNPLYPLQVLKTKIVADRKLVRDRRYRLRKYDASCLVGSELVTWLIKNGHATSKD
eukprot:CAMPEP_0175121516 /NCGR_PEP_ID=MMETSP0087-20121206/1206_1 /TAXON_ID=136419 /ORGANISM="Unknown Unknown, Strain D1" /LENGTH=303 /DNA_ID=CAMNT_0016403055 /DNA_START=197 /DNA_END=1105 /DNA_ORIENTATION=-